MEQSKSTSIVKKIVLFFSLIVIAVVVVFYLVSSYTYSEGSRAGLLIKFSKKGYVFKTYEGQLNIGGMQPPTTTVGANLMWNFSVKDSKVAEKMMQSEGKYVSLHYKEVIKNFWWQGETKYFVDGVEEIKR
jgi:hypothetical protein